MDGKKMRTIRSAQGMTRVEFGHALGYPGDPHNIDLTVKRLLAALAISTALITMAQGADDVALAYHGDWGTIASRSDQDCMMYDARLGLAAKKEMQVAITWENGELIVSAIRAGVLDVPPSATRPVAPVEMTPVKVDIVMNGVVWANAEATSTKDAVKFVIPDPLMQQFFFSAFAMSREGIAFRFPQKRGPAWSANPAGTREAIDTMTGCIGYMLDLKAKDARPAAPPPAVPPVAPRSIEPAPIAKPSRKDI